MRGKVNGGIGRTEMFGITPAYAGKRTALQRQQSQSWDHPRVCGEKVTLVRLSASVQGSPPRMRGKDCHAAGCLPGGRITPAYAGKRRAAVCRGGERWDHPRVCGEKGSRIFQDPAGRGSPPRMRGKGITWSCCGWTPRITPAYAGKRSGWPAAQRGPRDHPRVCGEKVDKVTVCGVIQGSPPRMRGKVCVCVCVCVDHPRVCGEKTKKIP